MNNLFCLKGITKYTIRAINHLGENIEEIIWHNIGLLVPIKPRNISTYQRFSISDDVI